MRWALQNNHVDGMTGRIAVALRQAGKDFEDFSLMPGEPLPEWRAEDDRGGAFFYGSVGLLQRMRGQPGWSRAVFGDDESLDQRVWTERRGEDMLNASVEIVELGSLRGRNLEGKWFARPAVDHKAFTGQVVERGDLSGLSRPRKGMAREHPESLLVAISPARDDLEEEARFIVEGGEVRLGSTYRVEGQTVRQEVKEGALWDAARELARGWLPASLCVMDVVRLRGGGFKIVEFNSIHSSGLYAIDEKAFIQVVERACLDRALRPEGKAPSGPRAI